MKAIQEIILKFQANDKKINLDLENKEELKPEKVKRNLDEMDLNEDRKLVCQNFSAENDDILNGKRSELRKSERRKPKRTSKTMQTITTSKRFIKVIRTSKR